MKAVLSIIDEHGRKYHGTAELSLEPDSPTPGTDSPATTVGTNGDINFSLPIRAFVRNYASGNSGGAAKFTMLLAFLSGGSSTRRCP